MQASVQLDLGFLRHVQSPPSVTSWPACSSVSPQHRTTITDHCDCTIFVIIRLETRLQPNIGFTFELTLAVFTRSGITPPKVNRFGWNLEESEYIAWGQTLQILGAISAVARAGESGEIFCQVNNAQLYRFPVCQISRNLNTTHRSISRWILSEQGFKIFL